MYWYLQVPLNPLGEFASVLQAAGSNFTHLRGNCITSHHGNYGNCESGRPVEVDMGFFQWGIPKTILVSIPKKYVSRLSDDLVPMKWDYDPNRCLVLRWVEHTKQQ